MPRAQVLQAFRADMAFHRRHQPTLLAMRKVYLIAAQPPPRFIGFIRRTCRRETGGRLRGFIAVFFYVPDLWLSAGIAVRAWLSFCIVQ